MTTYDGETFAGDDWYAEDLSGRTYRGCTFRAVVEA
jgi:hypothetical protein